MKPKKAIKGLQKQLKSDPGNLVVRIRLAGLLREIGSHDEAIEHYLVVAREYQRESKLAQALGVCSGILEFAPDRTEVLELAAELEAASLRKSATPNIRALAPAGPAVRKRAFPDMPTLEPGGAPVDRLGRGASHAPLQGESDISGAIASREEGPPSPPLRLSTASRPEVDETVVGAAPAPMPSSPAIDYPGSSAGLQGSEDDDEPTRIAGGAKAPRPWPEISSEGFRQPVPSHAQRASAPRKPARDTIPEPSPHGLTLSRDEDDSTDETAVDVGLTFDDLEAESIDQVDAGAPGAPSSSSVFLGPPPEMPAQASKLTPFAHLPDLALAELSKAVVVHRVAAGTTILREGEYGDTCYVIVAGEVRILKRDPLEPRSEAHEVARLGDGDLFGEFALLGDQRRHATVQAVESCTLYEVPRWVVIKLGNDHPVIRPRLEAFYRERMLQTLVATAAFFRPLGAEQRQDVISLFGHERYPDGHRIVHEGARSGGFCLILMGTVEIQKRAPDGLALSLAHLSEGAYFGELSLLRGDVARATVVARGPVEVARLEAKHFYTLVASNPLLWAHVWEEASRRELETCRIVAGTTGSV